jgi:hypothetical protein
VKIPQNRHLKANKNRLRSHRSLRHLHRIAVALTAVFFAPAPFASAECNIGDSFAPNIPLNDLGQGTYSNPPGTPPVQGGLYPGGFNQRPSAHNMAGINIAQTQIYPRNKDTGQRDPNGKIVMISIGMCNTTIEFGKGYHSEPQYAFRDRAMADNAKRGKLVVVDCAQAGQDAKKWTDDAPPNGPWAECISRLGADLSTKQVQVVWLKEALIDPEPDYGVFPAHVNAMQGFLETMLETLANVSNSGYFENVKMVFLSPRTRAWTLNHPGYTHNPEPYAYETGFADKWVIQKQVLGQGLNYDPNNGQVLSPWLSWGPYLWTNGNIARSDRLKWACSDVQDDFVHPTSSGVIKVADQLLAFFKTDPVATPWFVKTPDNNSPTVTYTLDPPGGTYTAGAEVTFHASASPHGTRTIKEYVWTFDDGDYAYDPFNQPLKTDVIKRFPAPSAPNSPYQVHLTVIDSEGNAAFTTVPITVNPAQSPHGSVEGTKHRPDPLVQPKQAAARKVGAR